MSTGRYTLRDRPERIVCLTEEPTETLYLLGEGRRVVGISAYTCRPEEARREKPVVSAFIGGSVAKIKALAPDLVIGFSDIQAKLASELITHGLQVLIFNQRSLDEILDVIVTVGRLVNREQRAHDLVADYQRRLLAARERGARRARRPRVYFEEWPDPLISGIRWIDELIEVVGGEHVFADRARGELAKDRFVTQQEILERAPEVVLASWCGKPFDRAAFEARPGFRDLPAVKSGHVYEIEPEIILQPGPACLTDGLSTLERLLDAWSP
jgi:iron complex transport system substrate-binding protein